MRLNGWQRLGIIISLIWVLVGGFWGNSLGIHEGDFAEQQLGICYAEKAVRGIDTSECRTTFENDYLKATKYHWYYAGAFAFGPIPFGWLLAWGAFALTRWVKAGFMPPSGS